MRKRSSIKLVLLLLVPLFIQACYNHSVEIDPLQMEEKSPSSEKSNTPNGIISIATPIFTQLKPSLTPRPTITNADVNWKLDQEKSTSISTSLLPNPTGKASQGAVDLSTSISTSTLQDTINYPEPTRTFKPPEPTETENPQEPTVFTGCPNGCTTHFPGCDIKGNISFNSGEKIYHVPGGEYYDATIINPDYGERWFCTEQEAIENGWRKSKH